MENFNITITNAKPAKPGQDGTLIGVLGSGQLEILIEAKSQSQQCNFEITTTVTGFKKIWQAVINDFNERYDIGGLQFTIHDQGAIPAVVKLRLFQALEAYMGLKKEVKATRYVELSARERIEALTDAHSFKEYYPPKDRLMSPHLTQFDLPSAFDDGIVIGEASIQNHFIYIAAQNAGFIGGAVGEIHGAKLAGLCCRAVQHRPEAIVLLLDSGGVRLQEANAGEIAISEIIKNIMDARFAGIPTIGIIAGTNGAFGGVGIIAACLDYLFISEQGRLGISGPEVIETMMGVEEYDASDRALVWRTCGGKHRAIMGDAEFTGNQMGDIQKAILSCLNKAKPINLTTLKEEHSELKKRLDEFRNCRDSKEIWEKKRLENPEQIPNLDTNAFLALLTTLKDH